MSFEFQSRQVDGYTDSIAEHQLMIDWLKLYPWRGELDYLDQRVIDKERQAVAYYIEGWEWATAGGLHLFKIGA